jgi:molybdopterin-guanine dinucleotide biosynthesis protein A
MRLIQVIHEACPDLSTFHMSFAENSPLDDTLRARAFRTHSPAAEIRIEIIFDDQENDIGPAAGLSAAFHHNPDATWLVVACDYPLIQVDALRQLLGEYEDPVTCFRNVDGFCEPFLGIWGPEALHELEQNIKAGILSPNRVIKQLGGKTIKPTRSASGGDREWWLTNTNTQEEWEAAKRRLG